jgi:outer membrane protein assembly factor BamB
MWFRRAALGLAFLPAAAAQQPPSSDPGLLLVRQQLVSMRTLQPTGDLGLFGYVRDAQPLGGDNWSLHDLTIDAAAREVLEVSAQRVRLRTVDKRELWTVDRAAAHVTAAAAEAGVADVPRRVFGPGRVVLPRDGAGLVALDRATGRVAWEQPTAPAWLLVPDPELLLAVGGVDGKPVLGAFAWANGAQAFRVELPAPTARVVAGPRAVAIVFADHVAVHDRGGPLLRDVKVAVQDLVLAPNGWFVRTADTVQAWSTEGEPRWTAPVRAESFETLLLAATTAGDLIVAKYHRMADSGIAVQCFAAADGDVLWRHDDGGLEVDHSKYWHRVHAQGRGDAVFLVSQAAGGNFVVELDAATGARRRREVLGRP